MNKQSSQITDRYLCTPSSSSSSGLSDNRFLHGVSNTGSSFSLQNNSWANDRLDALKPPLYPFQQQQPDLNSCSVDNYPTSSHLLSNWNQTPSSSLPQAKDLKSPSSSSSTTMPRGRKRRSSVEQSEGTPKKIPSRRQAKQERTAASSQSVKATQKLHSNYHGQPNDCLYPRITLNAEYRQPSPRNLVYAPTVSIPPANGQQMPPSSYNQQSQPYPLNAYPQQQYQQGLLIPPQSQTTDRLSPRPKSQNSNLNSTRTSSPQIGGGSASPSSQQPTIKIPQVQPPNYPYPIGYHYSYPSTTISQYPPFTSMYSPQWSNNQYGQPPRFGLVNFVLKNVFLLK